MSLRCSQRPVRLRRDLTAQLGAMKSRDRASAPRTMEEWVPVSFVENSSLITPLGTFRDKVKVEHTWTRGKQGLYQQSEAGSPYTKHVKSNDTK